MNKTCANCGKQNLTVAQFCSECGNKLGKGTIHAPTAAGHALGLNEHSGELQLFYSAKNDEELIIIIEKEAGQYTDAAIQIAVKELKQRGYEIIFDVPQPERAQTKNSSFSTLLILVSIIVVIALIVLLTRSEKPTSHSTIVSDNSGAVRPKTNLSNPFRAISTLSLGDVGVLVREADIPPAIVSLARSSEITQPFEQVLAYTYDLDGDGNNEYFVINGVAGGATHFVTALFVLQSNQWIIAKKEISNPQVIPRARDGRFFESYQSGNKWESPPVIRIPYRLTKGLVVQAGPPDTLESKQTE